MEFRRVLFRSEVFVRARSHLRSGIRQQDKTEQHIAKGTEMKTMTCKQLGGPCELGHSGDSADEIIKAQDKHLRAAVKAGDESHQEARQEVKFRWLHPKRSMGWYNDTRSRERRVEEECVSTCRSRCG